MDSFKASFPHLGQRSQSLAVPPGHTLTDALDVAHPSRYVSKLPSLAIFALASADLPWAHAIATQLWTHECLEQHCDVLF